jgi:hypothetical protein
MSVETVSSPVRQVLPEDSSRRVRISVAAKDRIEALAASKGLTVWQVVDSLLGVTYGEP